MCEMPELNPNHERQIMNAIDKLNKTMKEIRKYIPEARYYIENGNNFNVMSGDTHNSNDQPNYENVMLECLLRHSECGGW